MDSKDPAWYFFVAPVVAITLQLLVHIAYLVILVYVKRYGKLWLAKAREHPFFKKFL